MQLAILSFIGGPGVKTGGGMGGVPVQCRAWSAREPAVTVSVLAV